MKCVQLLPSMRCVEISLASLILSEDGHQSSITQGGTLSLLQDGAQNIPEIKVEAINCVAKSP